MQYTRLNWQREEKIWFLKLANQFPNYDCFAFLVMESQSQVNSVPEVFLTKFRLGMISQHNIIGCTTYVMSFELEIPDVCSCIQWTVKMIQLCVNKILQSWALQLTANLLITLKFKFVFIAWDLASPTKLRTEWVCIGYWKIVAT